MAMITKNAADVLPNCRIPWHAWPSLLHDMPCTTQTQLCWEDLVSLDFEVFYFRIICEGTDWPRPEVRCSVPQAPTGDPFVSHVYEATPANHLTVATQILNSLLAELEFPKPTPPTYNGTWIRGVVRYLRWVRFVNMHSWQAQRCNLNFWHCRPNVRCLTCSLDQNKYSFNT